MSDRIEETLAQFARRRSQLLSQESQLWNDIAEWLDELPDPASSNVRQNSALPIAKEVSAREFL